MGIDMPTMISRVATAICERRNANDWPCNGLDFDQEMARVAIEAMMPLTKEMVIAGTKAKIEFPDSICAIYQAMLMA